MKLYLQANDGFNWLDLIDTISDYYAAANDLLTALESGQSYVIDTVYEEEYLKITVDILPPMEAVVDLLYALVHLADDKYKKHVPSEKAAIKASNSCSRVSRKKSQLMRAMRAIRDCHLSIKRRK